MDEEKDLPEASETTSAEDESKSAISADLIRGHINTIILRTLYERDKYGYEIIEEIEKKSHGQYTLKQPTLYSALKRLESQGYITAYWKTDEVSLGGRRKYYTLTESGREITEKNQAEWEYSRTVIDNLISDRSFDFSQPAPTSVDMKILKKSTSRVPIIRSGDDEDDAELKEDNKEPTNTKLPEVEIKPETVTYTEQIIYYDAPIVATPSPVNGIVKVEEEIKLPTEEVQKNAEPVVQPVQAAEEIQAPAKQFVAQENPTTANQQSIMSEEQKRIVHENYLRLISEPIVEQQTDKEVDIVPVADDIDTDKLIYNNKPETERDYRNLINNLFKRTIKPKPEQKPEQPTPQPQYVAPAPAKLEDITDKANSDGLKVNSSEYIISTRKKSYNRGGTLFKSSLIVAIVLLFEFILCLIFKKQLEVGYAYPFVILAIDLAQLLIFGVLYYTDLGKNTRKPSSNLYLSACIIITVILILIIFIISILLNVNFSSAGDIFAKIIVPCLVAVNIPIFAGCFYEFSK